MVCLKEDFVTVRVDEFHDKTFVSHRVPLTFTGKYDFSLCFRKTLFKQNESIVIDFRVQASETWFPRKMIMLIDGKTNDLIFFVYDGQHYTPDINNKYTTRGHISVDIKLLKKICSSESFKIQIYGEPHFRFNMELSDCARLRLQAQQFYNNVYDESAYPESVSMISPRQHAEDELVRVSERKERLKKLKHSKNTVFFTGLFVIALIAWASLANLKPILALSLILFCLFVLIIEVAPTAFDIARLEKQINNECEKCHKETIIHDDTTVSMLAVRSVEKIVGDRLTGANVSKQVTVTDQEVTSHYRCTSCGHSWSNTRFRTV